MPQALRRHMQATIRTPLSFRLIQTSGGALLLHKGLRDDLLDVSAWEQLEQIHTALHPYYEATLKLEGRNGAKNGEALLCRWFGALTWIMKKTEDSRALFEGPCMDDADCIYSKTFYPQAQAAFEKIEKYWNIVDRTSAYYASMILDPRQKKKWFRKHWTSDIEAP
jgi:hypothetical protein